MPIINRKNPNPAYAGGIDQYYTPIQTAMWVKSQIEAVMPIPSLVVEPSAGMGAFMDVFKNSVGYDLEPGRGDIIKADWLDVDPKEFKNALVVGNPPYGFHANQALRFINHSANGAAAIAFILPPLFDRVTMARRISLDFSLVMSVRVPYDVYTGPSGEKYVHRRILQIWARGERRVLEPLPDGSPWVRHLSGPQGADVFVVRNGSRAGSILMDGNHSIRFAWPMMLLRPDSLDRLRSVEPQMLRIANLGTSIPNMPKVEINVALQELEQCLPDGVNKDL